MSKKRHRQTVFIILILAAICAAGGPASSASQCSTYVTSSRLLDSDVQPHVGRILGPDAQMMGVYQPVDNFKTAVIFTDQGQIRIYRLNGGRWYDPKSGQFVCR